MQQSKTYKGSVLALLALGALTVLAQDVSRAQTTGSEEIFACADKKSGQLRVVTDPGACKPSETSLSWNREGSPGVLGLQVVSVTTDVPTSEQNRNGFLASAFCPSDMLATGGGFLFHGGGILVKASRPIGTTPTGWQAMFAYGPDVPNPPPPSAEVTVFVVCAIAP